METIFYCSLFLALSALPFGDKGEGSGGTESSTTTTTTRSTSVNVLDNNGAWYNSPWVWVVGAAAFILLLVALLSNKGRDTVRVSKTVKRDA
jgi:hypothetical protein